MKSNISKINANGCFAGQYQSGIGRVVNQDLELRIKKLVHIRKMKSLVRSAILNMPNSYQSHPVCGRKTVPASSILQSKILNTGKKRSQILVFETIFVRTDGVEFNPFVSKVGLKVFGFEMFSTVGEFVETNILVSDSSQLDY